MIQIYISNNKKSDKNYILNFMTKNNKNFVSQSNQWSGLKNKFPNILFFLII